MKYCIFLIILIPTLLHAKSRPKVAILEISTNSMVNTQESMSGSEINQEDTYSKVIRNKIELSLYSSGKYELLERKAIHLIMKERGMSEEDLKKTNNALQAGRYLYADYVKNLINISR